MKTKTTTPKWKFYFVLGAVMLAGLFAAIAPWIQNNAGAQSRRLNETKSSADDQKGAMLPEQLPVQSLPPINFAEAARQAALLPEEPVAWNPIPAPKPGPVERDGPPMPEGFLETVLAKINDNPLVPTPSAQGSSPAPLKTFAGEYLNGGSIPPDTHGAVGTTHIMTVSNNQMNIRNRNGELISRQTLLSFWTGTTIKGIAVTSAFDPKVLYDRFNGRFIFVTTFDGQAKTSGVGIAVSQTNDPTGAWNRFIIEADPAATDAGGIWIDYPSLGMNKNWIIAQYNSFGYGTSGGTYLRNDVYVLDKQAAYAGTLGTISTFRSPTSACGGATPNQVLSCGFTTVPSVTEDNTTETAYFLEAWNSTNALLRLSTMTGTAAAPILNVGRQFPQTTFNWRGNAARIGTSGGYVPQRQQSAFLPSGTRIMANDHRIQNVVLRNGSLWTVHHVMVGATPSPPGTAYGTANPDIKTAVQWWQIDPTIDNTATTTPATQQGRIVDPIADNCNSGSSTGVSNERAGCAIGTAGPGGQQGQFFFFPSIAVNNVNDVFIGFTQSSPLTYASAAYAMRRASDPAGTMRDVVVSRSGASNYNLGSGTGATRQNRWGDYSMTVVDPFNDTNFWTNQEYSETRANFGIGIVAPWATWWTLVDPNSTQPTSTGNLIISEFRFRGPQGVSDEFIELYNPSTTTPFRVNSAEATSPGNEGWAVAVNNGATTTPLTIVPQGVVIPPRGHYLIANSPVSDATGAENLYFGLTAYPGASLLPGMTTGGARTATADTGYSAGTAATDIVPDNSGVALFRTANSTTGFIAANQADAAGFAGAGTTFREGTGIPAITAGAVTGQISFVRRFASGSPQDTGNNANDFIFVNTLALTESLGSTPTLGAPGPENVDSPPVRSLGSSGIDNTVALDASPNQVRNMTPVTNGANGTVEVRRNFTNNTGQPIVRLRFRISSLTTFPNTPDFRLLSSNDVTVTSNDATVCNPAPAPCNLTVRALTLETPPAQPNGGGLFSSVHVPVVTLATPIPAGSKIQVNFLFGVNGAFFAAPEVAVPFDVVADVLAPPPVGAPTAASVLVSGRVMTANKRSVPRAIVTIVDPSGNSRQTITNSFGYYRFYDIAAGQTYIFTVSAKRYAFDPQAVTVNEETEDLNFTAH